MNQHDLDPDFTRGKVELWQEKEDFIGDNPEMLEFWRQTVLARAEEVIHMWESRKK